MDLFEQVGVREGRPVIADAGGIRHHEHAGLARLCPWHGHQGDRQPAPWRAHQTIVKGHSPQGFREVIPLLPPRGGRGRPIRPRPLQGAPDIWAERATAAPGNGERALSGGHSAQKIRFPLEQEDKKPRHFGEL